jgi:hypothetical protein
VASSADLWFVLVFDLVRLSAPVPWLSGRASASHAEGRWFDPSRDHSISAGGVLGCRTPHNRRPAVNVNRMCASFCTSVC